MQERDREEEQRRREAELAAVEERRAKAREVAERERAEKAARLRERMQRVRGGEGGGGGAWWWGLVDGWMRCRPARARLTRPPPRPQKESLLAEVRARQEAELEERREEARLREEARAESAARLARLQERQRQAVEERLRVRHGGARLGRAPLTALAAGRRRRRIARG